MQRLRSPGGLRKNVGLDPNVQALFRSFKDEPKYIFHAQIHFGGLLLLESVLEVQFKKTDRMFHTSLDRGLPNLYTKRCKDDSTGLCSACPVSIVVGCHQFRYRACYGESHYRPFQQNDCVLHGGPGLKICPWVFSTKLKKSLDNGAMPSSYASDGKHRRCKSHHNHYNKRSTDIVGTKLNKSQKFDNSRGMNDKFVTSSYYTLYRKDKAKTQGCYYNKLDSILRCQYSSERCQDCTARKQFLRGLFLAGSTCFFRDIFIENKTRKKTTFVLRSANHSGRGGSDSLSYLAIFRFLKTKSRIRSSNFLLFILQTQNSLGFQTDELLKKKKLRSCCCGRKLRLQQLAPPLVLLDLPFQQTNVESFKNFLDVVRYFVPIWLRLVPTGLGNRDKPVVMAYVVIADSYDTSPVVHPFIAQSNYRMDSVMVLTITTDNRPCCNGRDISKKRRLFVMVWTITYPFGLLSPYGTKNVEHNYQQQAIKKGTGMTGQGHYGLRAVVLRAEGLQNFLAKMQNNLSQRLLDDPTMTHGYFFDKKTNGSANHFGLCGFSLFSNKTKELSCCLCLVTGPGKAQAWPGSLVPSRSGLSWPIATTTITTKGQDEAQVSCIVRTKFSTNFFSRHMTFFVPQGHRSSTQKVPFRNKNKIRKKEDEILTARIRPCVVRISRSKPTLFSLVLGGGSSSSCLVVASVLKKKQVTAESIRPLPERWLSRLFFSSLIFSTKLHFLSATPMSLRDKECHMSRKNRTNGWTILPERQQQLRRCKYNFTVIAPVRAIFKNGTFGSNATFVRSPHEFFKTNVIAPVSATQLEKAVRLTTCSSVMPRKGNGVQNSFSFLSEFFLETFSTEKCSDLAFFGKISRESKSIKLKKKYISLNFVQNLIQRLERKIMDWKVLKSSKRTCSFLAISCWTGGSEPSDTNKIQLFSKHSTFFVPQGHRSSTQKVQLRNKNKTVCNGLDHNLPIRTPMSLRDKEWRKQLKQVSICASMNEVQKCRIESYQRQEEWLWWSQPLYCQKYDATTTTTFLQSDLKLHSNSLVVEKGILKPRNNHAVRMNFLPDWKVRHNLSKLNIPKQLPVPGVMAGSYFFVPRGHRSSTQKVQLHNKNKTRKKKTRQPPFRQRPNGVRNGFLYWPVVMTYVINMSRKNRTNGCTTGTSTDVFLLSPEALTTKFRKFCLNEKEFLIFFSLFEIFKEKKYWKNVSYETNTLRNFVSISRSKTLENSRQHNQSPSNLVVVLWFEKSLLYNNTIRSPVSIEDANRRTNIALDSSIALSLYCVFFLDILIKLHSLSYHYVISGDIGVALRKWNFVIKIRLLVLRTSPFGLLCPCGTKNVEKRSKNQALACVGSYGKQRRCIWTRPSMLFLSKKKVQKSGKPQGPKRLNQVQQFRMRFMLEPSSQSRISRLGSHHARINNMGHKKFEIVDVGTNLKTRSKKPVSFCKLFREAQSSVVVMADALLWPEPRHASGKTTAQQNKIGRILQMQARLDATRFAYKEPNYGRSASLVAPWVLQYKRRPGSLWSPFCQCGAQEIVYKYISQSSKYVTFVLGDDNNLVVMAGSYGLHHYNMALLWPEPLHAFGKTTRQQQQLLNWNSWLYTLVTKTSFYSTISKLSFKKKKFKTFAYRKYCQTSFAEKKFYSILQQNLSNFISLTKSPVVMADTITAIQKNREEVRFNILLLNKKIKKILFLSEKIKEMTFAVQVPWALEFIAAHSSKVQGTNTPEECPDASTVFASLDAILASKDAISELSVVAKATTGPNALLWPEPLPTTPSSYGSLWPCSYGPDHLNQPLQAITTNELTSVQRPNGLRNLSIHSCKHRALSSTRAFSSPGNREKQTRGQKHSGFRSIPNVKYFFQHNKKIYIITMVRDEPFEKTKSNFFPDVKINENSIGIHHSFLPFFEKTLVGTKLRKNKKPGLYFLGLCFVLRENKKKVQTDYSKRTSSSYGMDHYNNGMLFFGKTLLSAFVEKLSNSIDHLPVGDPSNKQRSPGWLWPSVSLYSSFSKNARKCKVQENFGHLNDAKHRSWYSLIQPYILVVMASCTSVCSVFSRDITFFVAHGHRSPSLSCRRHVAALATTDNYGFRNKNKTRKKQTRQPPFRQRPNGLHNGLHLLDAIIATNAITTTTKSEWTSSNIVVVVGAEHRKRLFKPLNNNQIRSANQKKRGVLEKMCATKNSQRLGRSPTGGLYPNSLVLGTETTDWRVQPMTTTTTTVHPFVVGHNSRMDFGVPMEEQAKNIFLKSTKSTKRKQLFFSGNSLFYWRMFIKAGFHEESKTLFVAQSATRQSKTGQGVQNGLDFLLFDIFSSYRFFKIKKCSRFELNISPAPSNIRDHLQQIREILKKNKSKSQVFLIKKLSPIIRRWSIYYKNVTNKKLFYFCDFITFKMLWRWACRRHPKKNKVWIKNKYFRCLNGKNWVFGFQKKTFIYSR